MTSEEPQETEEKTQPAPEKKAPRGASVQMGENIEIFSGKPLPQYNNGDVKAYDAVGKNNVPPDLFVLVCERHLTPRLKAASVYTGIINPEMANVVRKGVVFWPPANQERYIFVYEKNLGKPLMTEDKETGLGWKQEQVMEVIMPSMMNILQDFRDKDFVHGNIRSSNMFDGGAEKVEKIILGDCLSVPSSYSQPVVYETIERGMADPIGRGDGTQADDLYSLGVCIAVIMRTNDPLEGLSAEDIVKKKMESGSYSAVTGKDRFTGSILELLRGLLHDDPTQRWTVEEIMSWMDGVRLSPKQAIKQKKAPRAITLGENKYFQLPYLAMDFEKEPAEALVLIEEGVLEQWLIRALEDGEKAEALEGVIQLARDAGRGTGYSERLLSNISILLDPNAPARYKGIKIMGDGAGPLLNKLIALKEDVSAFVEIVSSGLVLNWAAAQDNTFLDVASILGRFDACRNALRQNKMGQGIERCLYILNPESPCLSEKFSDYFVLNPEGMMRAFEDMCQKGKEPALFLDRHSAAFLSVTDRKSIDSYLYDLNSSEDYKKILGNLKCLATIQKRSSLPPYPGIAKVFVEMLPAVYERYHDSDIREKLEKNIRKFGESGDLVKMAAILDSPEVLNKDHQAFVSAMREHASLRKEYKHLEVKLANKSTFGRQTGRSVAAVVSSIISSVVILAVVFMSFTGGSGP